MRDEEFNSRSPEHPAPPPEFEAPRPEFGTPQAAETQAHSAGTAVSGGADIHTAACDVCGASFTQAHQWDGGTVTAPATCTAEGVMTYTCTLCGESKTEAIPMTEHTWENYTDMGDGTHSMTCSVCQAAGSEEHTWDEGVETAAPTCTDEGVRTHTCTACQATKTEPIDPLGHAWGAQTEGTDRSVTVSCTACGHSVALGAPALSFGAPAVENGYHACVNFNAALTGADGAEVSAELSGGWRAGLGPVFSQGTVVALFLNDENDLQNLAEPLLGTVTLTVTADNGAVLTQMFVFTVTPGPAGGDPAVTLE